MIAASLLALARSPATASVAPASASVMTTAAMGTRSSAPATRPVTRPPIACSSVSTSTWRARLLFSAWSVCATREHLPQPLDARRRSSTEGKT